MYIIVVDLYHIKLKLYVGNLTDKYSEHFKYHVFTKNQFCILVEIDLLVLKICLFAISGQDRNFALERYGTDSRCFDHTEQMWEERSCEQVMFDTVSNKKGYDM